MNKNLGQVYTKKSIADFMVNLFDLNEGKILDPCFGTGVFIKSLSQQKKYYITGIEIDKELFNSFDNEDNCNIQLENCDFLSYEPNCLYDGVIMNPPYIRHELINNLKEYGVSKESLRSNKLYTKLPANANMYMYFITKAIKVVKNEGQIVIIFPLTWMKAKSGNSFKKVINENCNIEKIIYVNGYPFEKEALVDVIILKIVKTKRKIKTSEETIEVNGDSIKRISSSDILESQYHESNFVKYAEIRRGLTTGHNRLFINPNIDNKNNIYSIISSPKAISGFTTKNAQEDKVLVVYKNDNLSEEVQKYLKKNELEILASRKPKTLYEKISNGDAKWYLLNTFDCKGIIFGYIVRDNMKFILNNKDCLIRDNFYVIKPKINNLLLFAMLNNYYIFYQLENKGKKYGAGLLKLQKYDLEELVLPNIELFSEKEIETLIELANKLIVTSDVHYIDKITMLLSNHEYIQYNDIKSMYFEKKKKRLGDLS